MSKSKRAKEVRGVEPQHLSANCRRNYHGFCTGHRYLGHGVGGFPYFGRCKCRCHG